MSDSASVESIQITYRAKCLCESIVIEMRGEPSKVIVCHCANCKQISGSAFMIDGFFNEKQVLITKGEEVMSTYEDTKTASGKPMKRCFCSKCGSALLSKPTAFEGLVLVHPVGMDKMTWVPTKEYHPQDRWEWIGELKSIVE